MFFSHAIYACAAAILGNPSDINYQASAETPEAAYVIDVLHFLWGEFQLNALPLPTVASMPSVAMPSVPTTTAETGEWGHQCVLELLLVLGDDLEELGVRLPDLHHHLPEQRRVLLNRHPQLLEHRSIHDLCELVLHNWLRWLPRLPCLSSRLWLHSTDALSPWHRKASLPAPSADSLASRHWKTCSPGSSSTHGLRWWGLLGWDSINEIVNRSLPVIIGGLQSLLAVGFREPHVH